MLEQLRGFFEAFILLFVILDVVGNIPIFYSVTKDFPPTERIKIIKSSVKVASVLLLFFAVAGWYVLKVFNVSMDDFRIAGGVLLFIIAVEGLLGREKFTKLRPEEVSVVPLATPLLAGPGSLYTVIYLMQPPYSPVHAFFSIAANTVIAWVLLVNSEKVLSKIGRRGAAILSKIMAFIIAAIAVSMIRVSIVNIAAQIMHG